MKVFLLIGCLFISQISWSDQTDPASKLSSFGGQLELHSFYNLLNQFDIEVLDGVEGRQLDWSRNKQTLTIKPTAGLQLYAPYGGLKAVVGGRLYLNGSFSWRLAQGQQIDFKNLYLRPTLQQLEVGDLTVLDVVNHEGEVVFELNNIHAGFNRSTTELFMNNMDLRISPWLANKINKPELADHVVGQGHLISNLIVPVDYHAKAFPQGACVAGDNWPEDNPDVDVALIAMQEANYLGDVGNDSVIITPSATLENVGTADVAWWRKFTGSFDPYDNDQHPYLVWNMYREIDNRFEQIGFSGVKHAFFSTNVGCSCNGGNILYPTCQDKYSVGNNNLSAELGPRDDIEVFTGLWQSTGSFFDPDGNGIQENGAGSNGLGENRMVVSKSDFADQSLDYFISSWYVIRDDINIFNNMGSRQYQLDPAGNGWVITAQNAFVQGAASDRYVAPNTFDLAGGTASSQILRAGEGHITVAVKAVKNSGGGYTYNYMVENHDYDPQIQSVVIPLVSGVAMNDIVFVDNDKDLVNDWDASIIDNNLVLQSPPGNELDWGRLYSFSFSTQTAPQAGELQLVGFENAGDVFSVNTIKPTFVDLIFENGFE